MPSSRNITPFGRKAIPVLTRPGLADLELPLTHSFGYESLSSSAANQIRTSPASGRMVQYADYRNITAFGSMVRYAD